MHTARQVLSLLVVGLLVWFFYALGRQLSRSVSELWLGYTIILAWYGLALALLLTPLGPLLDEMAPMTGGGEPVFRLGWNNSGKVGLAFLMIVVAGFIGARVSEKPEDAINE
jgi:hypothetical protein